MTDHEIEDLIRAYLRSSAIVKQQAAETCHREIARAAGVLAASLLNGGKILLCGNGGSAADCQHMAAEFVSLLDVDFDRPALPAIALTTDTSVLTAHANDIGFERIFARQIQALGKAGDVLIAISTSGKSRNVVAAVREAQKGSIKTIALTGERGLIGAEPELTICVPSRDTGHIQEAHSAIEHVLCWLVEQHLYSGKLT